MAETTQMLFSHKEVVTALLKDQNIHEGIWMLSIQFGMGAANVNQSEGSTDIKPAAIITVLKIGLQRTEDLNDLSVDAALVNP
ncbi:MAG: hypothetical protein PHD43_12950 [Methylococcales bacterium]|nr:hypothetical protein [Methylococcales bacterium]